MAGLEARVQRVGQGLVVIALSLMAMVAIGSTTAHAENATIQTPTVAASPVATASPTPSNPVSTPASRVVGSAVTGRGMNPDTCNTTISAPTTDCPVTMKLVATNLSAATSTYRVGDTVQFDIALATIRPVSMNAIQAYLDFPVSDLQLVTGPTNLTPRPVSSTVLADDGIVAVASGAFGLNATVLKNSYTQTGTAPNIVGQINFDAGTALPSSGPTTNISLVPGTDTVIGSVFLRIRNNPVNPSTASHTVSLKDSAASGGRYGIVSTVNGTSTGTNILGPVSGTTVAVAQTIANVTAIPATPFVGTVRRIGDVVPVALVINPTTTVRNANRARVTATFNTADFMLVSGPTGSPPTAVTAGASTGFADTTGSAFWSPTSASSYTVSGTTGTVTITVTGINRLAVDAGSGPHVVATVYLRPLRRGSLDINTTAATIGEFTANGDNPDFNWTITTTSGTVASVPAVRGTIGLGLTVSFPPAVTSGLAPPLEVTTTGTVATGTVTDLRFLDVQVAALAGTADMQQADRFDLDITYDPTQISFATSPASGTDFALASGTAATPGNSAVAVATPGTVQVRLVRTATPSLLTTPTAVVRLRFSVLAGIPATSAVTLGIATTTDIRQQAGTPFVTNLYDSGRDAQTLDVLPAVTRQKPSTLTVEALLQGRAATDADARFIQTMRVGLRRPGETTFAIRRAQPVTPPSVATDGTNPATASATMRYTGTSARKPGSTTPLSTVTIGDLEPGTYDVLVKGRSALTVIIRGISLTPGGTTTAPATTVISLPEGDASGDDAINSADFVALSRTFGTETTSTADFNQSGYVDAWDFSLLARNFGLSGQLNLGNLTTSPAFPATTTSGASPTTHDVTLALPAGITLDRARVVVSGTAAVAATCPPSQPAGITCSADATSRVTLVATTDGGAGSGGTVTLGRFNLAPGTPGTGNISVTLAEATGHDSASPPTTVTVRAPVTGAVITVDPTATFDLNVTTQAPGSLTAGITLTVGGTATATGGRATIDYDPAHFTATCAVTQPAGVTCDAQSLSGRVSFTLDPALATFTGGPAGIGNVTLEARAGATGEGDLRASLATLTDTASDPTTRTTLVTAPSVPGADTYHYTVTAGAIAPLHARATVTATRVTTRTTGGGATIWLASPANGVAIAPGSIVPVSIGVTTGSQAIDATQVVLAPGNGFEFVDASGANTAGMLTRATGSPLPVVLRQALTATPSVLELGFARQVGSSVGSFSGQGLLGTVYLRVTGDATSGDAITVVPAGTGRFQTGLVADGASVTATLGQLRVTIDATGTLMIPGTVTVSPPVDAVIEPILAPIAGAPSNAPATAPSDGPGPASPAPRGASRPAATAPSVNPAPAPSRSDRVGFAEDPIRGVITLAIPGRGAIELRTGIAVAEPDAWCPVARHATYIRLEDTGIAGATFGVESGGVLDWVTPEQAGCVNWTAIATGGLTFTKETIMQFQLARAAPGAILWVLDGDRNGELYEVDALGVARYITAETFSSNQDHFTRVWANVIPVSSGQIDGLASRGSIVR